MRGRFLHQQADDVERIDQLDAPVVAEVKRERRRAVRGRGQEAHGHGQDAGESPRQLDCAASEC
eukprot:2521479-Prymnesium_polylepis.1